MATKLDESQRTKTMMNAAITVVALFGIIIVLQFFIGPRLFGRIDLTKQKFHTLSDASKAAATGLDDITIRVYISDPLPDSITLGSGQRVSLRGVAQSFRDKLEEYRAFSDGRIKLNFVTSNVRDEAEKAKLQLFTSEEARISQGRLALEEYALGASFHYRNVKEVLPLALNSETYEFDITSALIRLKDKYEKSQAMKQMLDKGKAIFESVQACNTAVQAATRSTDTATTDDGLKGLIQAAQQAGEDLQKLRSAKETYGPACSKMSQLMSADGAELRARKNEYINIFLGGVDEFVRTYDVLMQRLDAADEQEAMTALEVQKVLQVVHDEVDRDHDNLVNSPGQKRIGFVCGHGEFCPFVGTEPVVKKELAAILGQQNPFVQQVVGQASQIEDNVNQINNSINQNLFKRRGFDIAQVDLNEPVPTDIESLVIYGPTKPMSERALYHLDQFALSGKPVAVFAKSWDVSLLNIQAPDDLGEEERFDYTAIAETASNLPKLLEHYGVKLNNDIVAEPAEHQVIVVAVTTQRGRMRWQSQQAFPYPLLPTFKDLSTENILLRNMASLTLPYVSTVDFTDARKGQPGAEVLVTSSKEARVVGASDVPRISILPPETVKTLGAVNTRGPAPVAVMLRGQASSFFKGKDVPPKDQPADGEEAPKEDPKDLRRKDEGEVRLLVVGSNLGLESLNAKDVLEGFDLAGLAGGNMDLIGRLRAYAAKLQNWQLRIQQVAELLSDNIRFLFNVLDWSIANEALVEVRSKGFESRPLEKLEEGAQKAVTYANIFGVPVLFLVIGAVRHGLDRRRRRNLSALGA